MSAEELRRRESCTGIVVEALKSLGAEQKAVLIQEIYGAAKKIALLMRAQAPCFLTFYSGLAQLATAKKIKDNRVFWKFIRTIIEKYFNRGAPAPLAYKEGKLTHAHQKTERGRLATVGLRFESLRRDEEPRCAALVSFPPVLQLLPSTPIAQVSASRVSV
jgi:hypothetical protein